MVRQPACLLLMLLLAGTAAPAAVDENRAAGVKAAYLRHIATLATWPNQLPDAAGDPQPLVIGVLGSDPNGVAEVLRAKIESPEGLAAQGRPLQLRQLPSPGTLSAAERLRTLSACNLLFLSADSGEAWADMRDLVARLPIVTVGEVQDFAQHGGMIEYVIDRQQSNVRMIINLAAVQQAGLSLRARLLGLNIVTVVRPMETRQ